MEGSDITLALSNLIIDNNSKRLKYDESSKPSKSVHWGQRKLLISEIEFFTMYLNRDIKNPLCIYVGAAPGNHIPLLSDMFPSLQFHLYDTNKFAIKENDRIIIHNDFFTDDVAKTYAGQNNIFFISNIRSVDSKANVKKALLEFGITKFDRYDKPEGPRDSIKKAKEKSSKINEDGIWNDMQMQQDWVLRINPIHALLKFRLPWPENENDDRKVQYLRGIAFWQPWNGQTSTETRLKPVKNSKNQYELADWDILEYEQWCSYHNKVDREDTTYTNILTNTNDPILSPELLNDYDSTAEIYILKLYFNLIGITDINKILQFSQIITLSLSNEKNKSLSQMRGNEISTETNPFRPKQSTLLPTIKSTAKLSVKVPVPIITKNLLGSKIPAPIVTKNLLVSKIPVPQIKTVNRPILSAPKSSVLGKK